MWVYGRARTAFIQVIKEGIQAGFDSADLELMIQICVLKDFKCKYQLLTTL